MDRAKEKEVHGADVPEESKERMGLAPVFAAAFAAACCLALPILLGMLAGGTTAAAWGDDWDLLSLFIIGFALGGVVVVALSLFRSRRSRSGKMGPARPQR